MQSLDHRLGRGTKLQVQLPLRLIHFTLYSQWMKTKSDWELKEELCVFHLLSALILGYYAKDTHHHYTNTVPYRLHEKTRCLK